MSAGVFLNHLEGPEKTRSHKQPAAGRAEDAYNLLAGYRFARRYVGGKTLAISDPEGAAYGARILADAADSVTCLVSSPEALKKAREAHYAPNLAWEVGSLPKLPLPEERFDAVVALEATGDRERLGELVAEARRILKDGRLLVLSVPDKLAISNRGEQGLYAGELRELLEQHFTRVELYRQGAVSGAVVLKEDEKLSVLPTESAPFAAGEPGFGSDRPDTDFILAVCSDAELPGEGSPYLLLDRDRRSLDESEDAREDVELLKAEILQMQQTEVQTFQEIPDRYIHEISNLRTQAAEATRLRQRLDDIEGSRTYQLLDIYRRLRMRLDLLLGHRSR